MENQKKKTLVIGASPNRERYSFMAVVSLEAHGFEPVPLGKRKGEIAGRDIVTERPAPAGDIHTVTLYLSAKNQKPYYDYLLKELRPGRIIFNPGAENPELAGLAEAEGIEVQNSCTLVMLASQQY